MVLIWKYLWAGSQKVAKQRKAARMGLWTLYAISRIEPFQDILQEIYCHPVVRGKNERTLEESGCGPDPEALGRGQRSSSCLSTGPWQACSPPLPVTFCGAFLGVWAMGSKHSHFYSPLSSALWHLLPKEDYNLDLPSGWHPDSRKWHFEPDPLEHSPHMICMVRVSFTLLLPQALPREALVSWHKQTYMIFLLCSRVRENIHLCLHMHVPTHTHMHLTLRTPI